MATYQYSVVDDFPGSSISVYCLQFEIEDSNIVPALEFINIEDATAVYINFVSALSGAEETELDGIVSSHNNWCPERQQQEAEDTVRAVYVGDLLDVDTAGASVGDSLVFQTDGIWKPQFVTGGGAGAGVVTRAGLYNIQDNTQEFTVPFSDVTNADYVIVGALVNEIDANPSVYDFVIKDRTLNSFTVKLIGFTDSPNYLFSWYITEPGSTDGGGQVGDGFTAQERLALEIELAFDASNPSVRKELSYTGKKLTQIEIYTNDASAILLFTKVFSYTGKQLTQNVTTRSADGATMTKDFTYSGKRLIRVESTYVVP